MRSAEPGLPATRLNIGDAVHDGWLAFRRSPWVFVGFALLITLLQALIRPLQDRIASHGAASAPPVAGDWLLFLLGTGLTLLINLWGSLGLVRGAAAALEGRRPDVGLLLRWEGPAVWRLLRSSLLLFALIALPLLLILLLLGTPLAVISQMGLQGQAIGRGGLQLLWLLLAALLVVLLGLVAVLAAYLAVNQKFLVQISLLEAAGPLKAIQRGRQLIDPQWLLMLLLSIIEGLLLLFGLLACLVGLFVAWPVVICISTAAYRQLRQAESPG